MNKQVVWGPATSAEELARKLNTLLDSPLTSNPLDLNKELEGLLLQIGESDTDTGGSISFYGEDPIVPSRVPFGAMSALALAAKSALVASIWRDRTGQEQNLHIDIRKAIRRFAPFSEGKWELLNGYPPQGDMFNPFNALPIIHPTADDGWALPGAWYPGLRQRTLQFLRAHDDPVSIAEAIGKWDRDQLESAAETAGAPIAVLRNLQEVLAHDAFKHNLGCQPLISVEKIGDTAPMPLSKNPATPLEGVRALSHFHVIAGPAIGRALALHGADVLNLFRPAEVELETFHCTSHVGTRSARLDFTTPEGRKPFNRLLADADIFIANRRAGYLEKHDLTAEALSTQRPGLIHTSVAYMGGSGPWSTRVGFDITVGGALGLYHLEGDNNNPALTPIFVVADYAAGWLAAAGTLAALRRRAREGGSYRVTVSLARTTLWLMELGIFDRSYVQATVGSNEKHRLPEPDQFTVMTPMGEYTGVKEMVEMSRTPGDYRYPLNPIGAGPLAWIS